MGCPNTTFKCSPFTTGSGRRGSGIMADLEGILSKEEMEEIGLEPDQVKVLKGCFDGFADEDGAIPADNVGGILSMMGMKVKPSALKEIIEDVEEDDEALKKELKEAFRIYDKDQQGYITTDTLKEILREIDNKLSEEDLDGIIEEVDEDGSGTLDFDEFMEMMTGWESTSAIQFK